MKKFVSFNIKAKKNCDADGMILHCVNLKARNKSDNVTLKHLTKYNVSSDDIHSKYIDITKKVEDIKKKKIQKNANHYLEGVLAFSYEQVNEMGLEAFRKAAPELIERFGKEMADTYGFEYIGYSLHFDEADIEYEKDENDEFIKNDSGEKIPKLDKKGHTIPVRDENGNVKINFHAHVSFVNYDFQTNKARFREYQQKFISKRKVPNQHFVAMQDLAGKTFAGLGFERGISKTITKFTHLEKEEMEHIEALRLENTDLRASNDVLKDENADLRELNGDLSAFNDVLRGRLVKADKELNLANFRLDTATKQRDQALEAVKTARQEEKTLRKTIESLKNGFKMWLSQVSKMLWPDAKQTAQDIAKDLLRSRTGVDYSDIEIIENDKNVPENSRITTAIKKNRKLKY